MNLEQENQLKSLIKAWQEAKQASASAANLAKNAKLAEDRVAGAISAMLSTMEKDTVVDTEFGGVYLARIPKYIVTDWPKFYNEVTPEALEKRLLQSWAKDQATLPSCISTIEDIKLTIAKS